MRPSGLEPPTPTMSRWCSNQLSYGRIVISVCQCWQRGRILTTYPMAGKGKNAFSCDIPSDWCANAHYVDFLNINGGTRAPFCQKFVQIHFPQQRGACLTWFNNFLFAAYRPARCRMENDDCFWIQRILSDIMVAAKVRPMINPHQNPLGPIAGTRKSVSASR